MTLDPTTAAFLQELENQQGPQLHEMEPQAAREAFKAMIAPVPGPQMAAVHDLTLEGPDSPIPVRVYRPKANGISPVLVFFHGGGWVIGDLDTHDGLCRELASRTQALVVSVHYRLAPEHPYPAAAEDCHAAVCQVARLAAQWGGDSDRMAVAGDSAGGNLAAVVCQMIRDRGGPRLRYQLLVYPVTDSACNTASYRDNAEGYFLTATAMRWFWGLYHASPEKLTEPYASPLRAGDFSNLPDALVLTAEYDVLRDEGEAYGRALEAAGVEVEVVRHDGMIHGFFHMYTLIPKALDAVEHATLRLRQALA